MILVLDFGSQYTQLIARRVRELGVFSQILPYHTPLEEIKKLNPRAIILSGGPQSVYDDDAPYPDQRLFSLNIPILGICYGLQVMASLLGGKVKPSRKREYGFARLMIKDDQGLLKDISSETQVWMSHGDSVAEVPAGFIVSGFTQNCPIAVVEDRQRKFFGVQFHPEVVHTHEGRKLLANFLFDWAGLRADWSMKSFIEQKVAEIKKQVGQEKVVCGLSGGIDSLVTALLIHRAIGHRLICVLVDNGLLRKRQYEELLYHFQKRFSFNLIGRREEDRFLRRLKGVLSPEKKRKIIGEEFIRVFEDEAQRQGGVRFLAQGTIYPDVIESVPVKGPSASIKSHHNVGGLPQEHGFELVEPLRELFKDEVREVARQLGIPRDIIRQHPFPGPGLAVRVVGEVTRERLDLLREVDAILIEEIKRARLYPRLWQAFAVLLPVKAVGVMGDQRTYQSVVALRLVTSVDGMTADWYPASPRLLNRLATRIINEVNGVNRVVYDITSKPPGTIEWE
ncbi:glutamine-hydrolyzing GMP synthase [Candidatus Aminicenantes bacterium AC-334-K16]|jgi:GMP synthase (glutamine-hydrolysing)|nr:glutamine-hydrolyzing GMP synthase [Candidatus Aminicenantes bacterium AC-334-K16]